jgi:hypothetical protein
VWQVQQEPGQCHYLPQSLLAERQSFVVVCGTCGQNEVTVVECQELLFCMPVKSPSEFTDSTQARHTI